MEGERQIAPHSAAYAAFTSRLDPVLPGFHACPVLGIARRYQSCFLSRNSHPPPRECVFPGKKSRKFLALVKSTDTPTGRAGGGGRLRSVKRVSEMISLETFFLGGCIWNREGENGREGFLFRGSNETGAWIAIRLDLFLSRKDNELLMIRLEENWRGNLKLLRMETK